MIAIAVRNKTALELLAGQQNRGLTQFELVFGTGLREELMPTVLSTLEKRGLASRIPNDENDWFYQITLAGIRHDEEVQKKRRTSSFPPPRTWPPAR